MPVTSHYMNMPVSSISAKVYDFRNWIESFGETSITSYTVNPSNRVLNTITDFSRENIRNNFVRQNSSFYPDSYWSDSFEVSFIRSALFIPPQILIVRGEDITFCAAESVYVTVGGEISRTTPAAEVSAEKSSSMTTVNFLREPINKTNSDRVLHIFLSPWNNYGHWHMHNLTFIEWLAENIDFIKKSGNFTSVEVVCSSLHGKELSLLKKYTIDRLKSIGILTFTSLDLLNHSFNFENVLISSTSAINRGCRWPSNYAKLLTKLRLPQDKSAPRLIYCNRSHAGRRGMTNEDVLEHELAKLGFLSVRPGEITYDQQRAIFSNARIIIGSHGAALTNMIFSHCNPALIELTHDHYGRAQYEWFQFLSNVLSNSYSPIISALTEAQRGLDYYSQEFTVDILQVCAAVNELAPLHA